MNKVAVTYWDNAHTISMPGKSRADKKARARAKTTPQWFVFAVIASMTMMLCMAINLRAYAEMNAEIEQNANLNIAVEQLTNENIGLQSEVHSLKTDSSAIEREARKIGLNRAN